MIRVLISIIRSAFIAWLVAVTIGVLYAARVIWTSAMTHRAAHMSLFETTARTVLYTSPMIVMMSSFFALLAIPLAAWSVGSTSWSLLKKYIYGFWLVLAIYVVAFENADGLILISGAGLIILWILMNRGSLNPARWHLKHSVRFQMLLRTADYRRNLAVLALLTVIAGALSLFLFFGNGTKVYVSEMFAIYAVAIICQGFKAFATNVHGHDASSETAP